MSVLARKTASRRSFLAVGIVFLTILFGLAAHIGPEKKKYQETVRSRQIEPRK